MNKTALELYKAGINSFKYPGLKDETALMEYYFFNIGYNDAKNYFNINKTIPDAITLYLYNRGPWRIGDLVEIPNLSKHFRHAITGKVIGLYLQDDMDNVYIVETDDNIFHCKGYEISRV